MQDLDSMNYGLSQSKKKKRMMLTTLMIKHI